MIRFRTQLAPAKLVPLRESNPDLTQGKQGTYNPSSEGTPATEISHGIFGDAFHEAERYAPGGNCYG